MTGGRSTTRLMLIALAGLLVLPGLALAQDDSPRTAWGAPDLQGIGDFRTVTPMECSGDPGGAFLTEAEAVQAAVNRDVALRASAGRRVEAGGSVGGYDNFWMGRGSMMLVGFAQAQERDITCTYVDQPINPLIARLSEVCGSCGGDLCIGLANCSRVNSSSSARTVVYLSC